MNIKSNTLIVSSDELVKKAQDKYPKKNIIYVCLPLSGDFFRLLNNKKVVELDKVKSLNILFFGNLTPYKGLQHLDKIISKFSDSDLSVTIIGRGNLEKLAPNLYLHSTKNLNVQWINHFVTADEVVHVLIKSDFMFVMYDSVTATSQIDIANAFGIPVLVSDLDFFKRKVENGINGFIIKQDHLEKFIRLHIENNIKMNRNEIISFYKETGINNNLIQSLISNKIISK
nr:glycosyltransferase [Xenorhabdus lircayensis]